MRINFPSISAHACMQPKDSSGREFWRKMCHVGFHVFVSSFPRVKNDIRQMER